MSQDKQIDESWKDVVSQDKEGCGDGCGGGHDHEHEHGQDAYQVNFFNYVTSLGYQAMIFLGEIPNPMTGKTERSLPQAKFLIDTLAMIKDKTRGNLLGKEDAFLSQSLYELQMKYVELKDKPDLTKEL